ncbi:hypothetical protein IMG5_121980 [Ichthyophthirius multifiliis]|uniref:Uncharacterized protein n=1 Tax=Ichthyophthirius multifiliis TaxID=5932 RepID=G0QV83_ICHMU|nr:hypothetical protein IMG5_121980 [Ichthyophthirius multifiliis]EGR30867.1 hypothetical protein IMG5_121980 [Ichthyophthirius multifiliis]|eukprot:XP_004032454.1 hypothetical protein IMG5_121980 [Ichthyophthirius multifiliis]
MADKKIFREIEGIFGWIKKRNKLENGVKDEDDDYYDVEIDSKQQISEFFKFLDLDATKEEINALNELALIKKQEQIKRGKHVDNKHKDQQQENQFTYKDLLRVFIPDDDLTEKQIENDLEKEKKQLMNAFKILTPDKVSDNISMDRLKKMIFTYEKQYTGVKNTTDQKEIDKAMTKIDEIFNDLQQEADENGIFNFKQYLDDQFRMKK